MDDRKVQDSREQEQEDEEEQKEQEAEDQKDQEAEDMGEHEDIFGSGDEEANVEAEKDEALREARVAVWSSGDVKGLGELAPDKLKYAKKVCASHLQVPSPI